MHFLSTFRGWEEMKQCPKCGRWFKNTAALNAHLRFCREVQASTEKNDYSLFLEMLEVMITLKTNRAKEINKHFNLSYEKLSQVFKWGKEQYPNLAELVIRYVKS